MEITMMKTAAIITLSILLFTGCTSVEPSTGKEAEKGEAEEITQIAGQGEEEAVSGGWTEQTAGHPELIAAFDYFKSWIRGNVDSIINGSLPEAVELTGGATQVVAGLNIRLNLEDKEDRSNPLTVFLYKDFTGSYEIWRIESSTGLLYE